VIVDPVALEEVIPGRGLHILAAIFFPVNLGLFAQDARPLLFHVRHGHEGADVQTHAIVEVRVPADGLLFNRLPAHKDVVGRFAFKDKFEALLECLSGGQPFLRAVHTRGDVILLASNPVAQVGVDQSFEVLAVELMVVDQDREPVAQPVPDVPDERPLVK